MLIHRIAKFSLHSTHFMRGFAIYSPKMVALTGEQIDIIKATWKIPSANMIGSGEAILYKFFEKFPENQKKFHAFKNEPLDSLKGSPGFQSHASRIMTVFNNSVTALDNEDPMTEVCKIWTEIGTSHARRKISRKSFEELKEIILAVLTDACKLDEEQQVAWVTLMDTIYSIVYEKVQD